MPECIFVESSCPIQGDIGAPNQEEQVMSANSIANHKACIYLSCIDNEEGLLVSIGLRNRAEQFESPLLRE